MFDGGLFMPQIRCILNASHVYVFSFTHTRIPYSPCFCDDVHWFTVVLFIRNDISTHLIDSTMYYIAQNGICTFYLCFRQPDSASYVHHATFIPVDEPYSKGASLVKIMTTHINKLDHGACAEPAVFRS